MLRSVILVLALLAPSATLAVPVQLDVLGGSAGGLGFSTLHAATGCELGGFWRCGARTPIETSAASGLSLTANFDGTNRFDSIAGNLMVGGVSRVVSGALDFGVAAGQTIGQIQISGFGTFSFVNDRHGTQVANTWNPGATGSGIAYLWGQTFAPTGPGMKPPAGWGVDFGLSARPIPEPSAAVAFGIGALLVAAARGRRQP